MNKKKKGRNINREPWKLVPGPDHDEGDRAESEAELESQTHASLTRGRKRLRIPASTVSLARINLGYHDSFSGDTLWLKINTKLAWEHKPQ